MKVDIELYRVFYEVAEQKNITKASEVLYISQPAVTMSIKKLEEQLEMTLFIRTKRGVILTNEGKVLYDYVKDAIESLKIGENRILNLKKLESGNIRIGIGTILTKFFLMEHLEKFHKDYPKITINIDTTSTDEMLKNLENGKLDMAVIATDKMKYKNFDIVYSEEIQDIFISNREFANITDKSINLEELNNYPLLLQNVSTTSRQFLDKFTESNGIKLKSIMDLASYSLVVEFVKIGFGIGFVTRRYVEKELKENTLFEIKTYPKIPSRKIVVLTKKDYLPSFSVSKLINIMRENNNKK